MAEQAGQTIDCLCQFSLSFLLFSEVKSAQACWMSLKLSNSIIHIYSFTTFYGFNASVGEIFSSTAGQSGAVPLERKIANEILSYRESKWNFFLKD